MLKTIFASVLFGFFLLAQIGLANDLNLEPGKIYLLNFEEEILNLNANEKNLDAQILHTIFSDKTQLIVSLKNNSDSFLQVKTENNFYNYEIKNLFKPSEELMEIDFPPIENLDVDIFEGEN